MFCAVIFMYFLFFFITARQCSIDHGRIAQQKHPKTLHCGRQIAPHNNITIKIGAASYEIMRMQRARDDFMQDE